MKELRKFILFFSIISSLQAQTSLEYDYYASNFNSFNFLNSELASLTQISNTWNDQQIHFRWNGHLYQGKNLSLHGSIRNRLFAGFTWQENLNNFKKQLDIDFLDLTSINTKNLGIHHQIDRLYGEWEKGKVNIRIGRQRINWGIQNYWNSHDLFNQINFLNFDYIENPGADAIRIQYYQGYNSFEIALNSKIHAGLYKFNLYKYDFQILLAKYYEDYSIGFGWAGQIKNAGFKGEFNYFMSSEETADALVGSLSFDYSFKNGIYLSTGCLYRNQVEEFNPLSLYSLDVSAKSPMPFQYNFLYQIIYPVHPLVKIGGALIHDAELDFVFLNPQLSVSVSESLDLMLGSQMTFLKILDKLEDINQIAYTRLQWNL